MRTVADGVEESNRSRDDNDLADILLIGKWLHRLFENLFNSNESISRTL